LAEGQHDGRDGRAGGADRLAKAASNGAAGGGQGHLEGGGGDARDVAGHLLQRPITDDGVGGDAEQLAVAGGAGGGDGGGGVGGGAAGQEPGQRSGQGGEVVGAKLARQSGKVALATLQVAQTPGGQRGPGGFGGVQRGAQLVGVHDGGFQRVDILDYRRKRGR